MKQNNEVKNIIYCSRLKYSDSLFPNSKLVTILLSCNKALCYLKYSEVFQNTVHHVFFWQVFELVDEVDHVLAHGRAVDPVDTLSSLHPGVLRLQNSKTTSDLR